MGVAEGGRLMVGVAGEEIPQDVIDGLGSGPAGRLVLQVVQREGGGRLAAGHLQEGVRRRSARRPQQDGRPGRATVRSYPLGPAGPPVGQMFGPRPALALGPVEDPA
jgi:hypothetical protein